MLTIERSFLMSTKTPKTKFGKQMLYILLPFVLPLCLIILGIVLLANAKGVPLRRSQSAQPFRSSLSAQD